MAKKQFHISDILSITTGALVSNRHMDGIYDIMDHIVGKGISTIGLAQHADKARQFLERELPWVKEVEFSIIPKGLTDKKRKELIDHFVKEMADKYGEYHEVGQMTQQLDVSPKADIDYIVKLKRKGPRNDM